MDASSSRLYGNRTISPGKAVPAVPADAPQEYVLIIDDDPAIVDFLVSFLQEDEGFRVHAFRSLRDLLSHIPTRPPALILLDVTMPNEDPAELAPSLRRLPGWEDAPIVLCSGQESLKELVRASGAAAYLTKPFSLDDIADLAHRYLPAAAKSPQTQP